MNTPICDFVTKYAESGVVRLHMPGHKGECILGAEPFDITEIEGADVLYQASGIIAESQQNASALFGTAKTLYSTEGSSLCIRAMLRLVLRQQKGEGRPWILAARNAHKSFLSACALLDVDAEWIYPRGDESILSCKVSVQDVKEGIAGRAQKPIAVYITSPDYLGNVCDVAAIADVCHSLDVPLLVDNAHGAYLNFLPISRHPIALGADMCCDSAHKTLPVLTGGAYLHISKNAPQRFCDGAEQAMALFASTSPSYLILQSLDKTNAYLGGQYKEKLRIVAERLEKVKKSLSDKGFCIVGQEPLKLTVAAKSYGYTGEQLAQMLRVQNVVCEFADRDFCVMMFTPEIEEEGVCGLESAVLSIEKREPIKEVPPLPRRADRVKSIREAILADSVEVDVKASCGRILAMPSVSCPPAIPVIMCGERVDAAAIRCFEYYGIKSIRVIKE